MLSTGSAVAMVREDLPFGERTARMLKRIVEDPRITDRNHGSGLPASWRTLYEITKLDDDQWQCGLGAGGQSA